jgi:membrane protease YdiL (CAAX protease family)
MPLLGSTITWLGYSSDGGYTNDRIAGLIVLELTGIAVLAYVLFRQGRGWSQLGFGFQWRDLPLSIGLFLAGYLFYMIGWTAISYFLTFMGHSAQLSDVAREGFQKGTPWMVFLMVLINPFFEEAIVRAYATTEIWFLANSRSLAIICSILLQTSYHLYQGLPAAFSVTFAFALWALYYGFQRRIWPVILAHFYWDAMAIVWR